MENDSTLAEKLVALLVLIMVGAQTWTVIQDATQGDAGRWVDRWWTRSARPRIVKLVMWVDAKALTERMVTEELPYYLSEEP